jgi:molecular chaperone GrpE
VSEQNQEQQATETPIDEQVEQQSEAIEGVVEEATEQQGDDLQAQLDAANEEIASLKDSSLRVQAEAQNVRRRAEGDVEKARKFALEKFATELLSVMDNLERAIEAGGEDASGPAMEGVELTRKNLADVFARFKIEAVSPEGEPFDPQQHQAMSMIENPDCEPNTVMHVVQKGYTLSERLIRPAMVMVSK